MKQMNTSFNQTINNYLENKKHNHEPNTANKE